MHNCIAKWAPLWDCSARVRATREIEFGLHLEVAGTTCELVVRQFMNDLSLTGLAPGEPVSVLYDRDDPAVLIVMQSPAGTLTSTERFTPSDGNSLM